MSGAEIVKLMSTTRAEFERSLAALVASARLDAEGWARLPCGSGHVCIRFEQLPPRRLGGLVVMPQARVTLDLAAVPEEARGPFMVGFDRAFQRGGG